MARSPLIVCIGLLALGCAGSAPPDAVQVPPSPPPSSAEPRSSPAPNLSLIEAVAWQRIHSRYQSVEFPLPVARQWHLEDTDHWLTATHARSQSELRVRLWRAGRRVTPAECEKQLRLWRPDTPDPWAEPDTVIEERTLERPEEMAVTLRVGVKRGEADQLEGYALAIGAGVRRCYAAVFLTVAQGAGAETAVGDRLALITDGVLSHMHRLDPGARVR